MTAPSRAAGNLAELARTALAVASGCAQDVRAMRTALAGLRSTTGAVVADTCLRGDLGFVLLLHPRKDGCFAEELYFSARPGDGSWAAADHLSGGVTGVAPTGDRDVARMLNGRPLASFGESETALFTGRPQSDDGYESLRFHEVLVHAGTDHLDVEDLSPGADPARRRRTGKPLVSRVALFALFPGERLTVRAMVREGTGSHPLGEPLGLTGPDAGQTG
ncbi:hypothetical protein [Streptomyces sp. NPDC007000]|uniref:hypothetical protein n=1 Tax=Streptomyces sp. NPDC007000 TaxID=3155357 RepID=UPI0033E0E95A